MNRLIEMEIRKDMLFKAIEGIQRVVDALDSSMDDLERDIVDHENRIDEIKYDMTHLDVSDEVSELIEDKFNDDFDEKIRDSLRDIMQEITDNI